MQSINEVRLAGQVSKVYPIKHFNEQTCMLIAEIYTEDETGGFSHRVSFLNQDAIAFSKNAQLGAMVCIDAKLTPRLKNLNNPTGEVFFEIRCMNYYFVAEAPVQAANPVNVYPDTIYQPEAKPTFVQRMIQSFTPQKQIEPPKAEKEDVISVFENGKGTQIKSFKA